MLYISFKDISYTQAVVTSTTIFKKQKCNLYILLIFFTRYILEITRN